MNIIEVDGNYTEECYVCIHKRRVRMSAMISCDDPDEELIGHEQGTKNGWFNYPSAFDPVWIANKCRHFSLKDWEKDITKDRQTLINYLLDARRKKDENVPEAENVSLGIAIQEAEIAIADHEVAYPYIKTPKFES